MFTSIESKSNFAKVDNKMPKTSCVGKVTFKICKLEYFFNTTRFN